MFQPVSSLLYVRLNPTAQALIVSSCDEISRDAAARRWKERACAVVDDTAPIRDVVRDLLANPQIRSIVFDGDCCSRDAYARVWDGETPAGWNIDEEHVTLVRRFVDLYDDDFGQRGPQQPFWPLRIRYLK